MTKKEKKKLHRILNTLTILITLVADRGLTDNESYLWREVQDELEEWDYSKIQEGEKEKKIGSDGIKFWPVTILGENRGRTVMDENGIYYRMIEYGKEYGKQKGVK